MRVRALRGERTEASARRGKAPAGRQLKLGNVEQSMEKSSDKEVRTIENKEVIRISVRNLVEFILRSGDLDTRRGTFADKEAMAKGSRIHRKIQKKMSGYYQPEVSLFHETEYDEIIIRVEGRADGIIDDGTSVIIDEIKGVYKDKTGLVVVKFNEVEDWEKLGLPKGSTTKGTHVKTFDYVHGEAVEGEAETGNIKFFVHGLDYSNQLAKFDAFYMG